VAGIQDYLNLVTSQHSDKPKFIAWLTLHLQILDDVAKLADDLYKYFDLDLASGSQQDVIGSIVGIKRRVDFQPSDGSSPILDDDTYRQVIRAKILRNLWDGSIPQIYNIWNTVFPDTPKLKIVDNQDMTMLAKISLFTPLQKDLASRGYIIPKPQGVGLNFELEFESNEKISGSDTTRYIVLTPGDGQLWGNGRKWGQGFWFPPAIYTPSSDIVTNTPELPKGSDSLSTSTGTVPYTWGNGRKWGQSTYQI